MLCWRGRADGDLGWSFSFTGFFGRVLVEIRNELETDAGGLTISKHAQKSIATQTTGNIGLYYVCYRLSCLGWNVMPTARNARGIDLLAYNQRATKTVTVQVKALSKMPAVPFGGNTDNIFGDYLVVCANIGSGNPECFILTPAEAKKGIIRQVKNDNASHWMPRDYYCQERFREKWQRIGKGGR